MNAETTPPAETTPRRPANDCCADRPDCCPDRATCCTAPPAEKRDQPCACACGCNK